MRRYFINWLAVKGRRLTQDRIRRWDALASMGCVTCDWSMESKDDLFF